jgi:hypothetical protein
VVGYCEQGNEPGNIFFLPAELPLACQGGLVFFLGGGEFSFMVHCFCREDDSHADQQNSHEMTVLGMFLTK